ncbi:MAG: NAD-dependent epimerase/dehydratase family protein [Chloroflexota bacterium]
MTNTYRTTALVTGGAGFLGSHIVDRMLSDGWRVVALDDLSTGKRENLDSRAELMVEDIRSANAAGVITQVKPDVIVHAAAQISVSRSAREPLFDAEVNVLGSLRVMEAARRSGTSKLIFISTGGAIYGQPRDLPVSESLHPKPESPYGASKLAVEGYLATYNALYGLNYSILRPGNIYGPRQDPHGEAGVVAIFSRAMLAGQEVKIFGDGEDTRDYVYAGDVADAVVRAVHSGRPTFYNVASGKGTSVNQLFARLAALTGYSKEPEHAPPREGDIHHITLDPARVRIELGWTPTVGLDDGLYETVQYFRKEVRA